MRVFEAGSKFLSVSFKFVIWLYTCWNGIILLNWCMRTGIYTVLIGIACVILMNFSVFLRSVFSFLIAGDLILHCLSWWYCLCYFVVQWIFVDFSL